MRKRPLLAAVIAVEAVVGLEFQGRAVSLGNMVHVENYAVMSCMQMEENGDKVCSGQCAQVRCDDDEVGGCTSEARQVVRVADKCANCERGDVLLSEDVYRRLSGASSYSTSVRWECVDCISSRQSSGDVEVEMQGIEESICLQHGSTVGTTSVKVGGSMTSMDNTTNGDSGENSASSAFDITASSGTDTSGSLDAVIGVPPLGDNTHNNSENGSSSHGQNSDGSIWSGTGSSQLDTKPGNGQGENPASPTPTSPPVPGAILPPSSTSSSSKVNGDSSPPSPVPTTTASSAGGSWYVPSASAQPSGGLVPSVSTPALTAAADRDSSYPAGTSDENPRDRTASSAHSQWGSNTPTTKTPSKSRSPASTAPPAQSSSSNDQSSSDGNFSATSAVTKSPFFYASLVLGVVGLIGIIAGYRAKRRRNHHNEMRALRMSMRTLTPGSNSRPTPTSPARSRLDSHDIVIL